MNSLNLLSALGSGVYSAYNRNEYQKQRNNVSWIRAQPMRKADNLAAIREPTNIGLHGLFNFTNYTATITTNYYFTIHFYLYRK
jgi:hypothetical protein